LTAKATLNGTITVTGGENATSRGFEWGTQTGVYPSSWTENGSFGVGAYDHQVTGLTEDITIFYRAKATNSAGTGYGAEQTFKTWKGVLPTDSGAGLEAPSLSSTSTLTDSGIGAEGIPSIGLSFADMGSGSESSLELQCDIHPTDSGVGSETSLTLAIAFSIADANSISDETIRLGEYKNYVDSVAGSDTAESAAAVSASDAGAGVDSLASLETLFTISDSGGFIDAAALTAAIPVSDSATGTEGDLILAVSFTITDAASGAEIETTVSSFTVTDSGTDLETATISASFTISDSATDFEAITLTTSFSVTDTGSGADAQTTLISFTVSDSGGLSYELATLLGYPFITDSGVTVEVFSKQFDVFEEALGAEFAWRQKGSVLIDALELPHVLSIRVVDDATIVDKKLQGGSLPKRKMIGKPGRVVKIVGWSDSQSEIDALEALVDGTARTFYHPSGDSFAVLVTGFNPDQSVDEYDRRAYRLSLVELRSW
jgi:hypothetical protein